MLCQTPPSWTPFQDKVQKAVRDHAAVGAVADAVAVLGGTVRIGAMSPRQAPRLKLKLKTPH
jgi:hypothetical protein